MNTIVKALARDTEPDHATIAAFISGNPNQTRRIFTEVLLECGELELIGEELFAMDRYKQPLNTSTELKWTATPHLNSLFHPPPPIL
jgi:transposase